MSLARAVVQVVKKALRSNAGKAAERKGTAKANTEATTEKKYAKREEDYLGSGGDPDNIYHRPWSGKEALSKEHPLDKFKSYDSAITAGNTVNHRRSLGEEKPVPFSEHYKGLIDED